MSLCRCAPPPQAHHSCVGESELAGWLAVAPLVVRRAPCARACPSRCPRMRWGGVEGEVSLGDPAALTLTLTCWRAAECRHPTGGEKMGSPTLQTHQDPVLLPCLRGEPNPNLGHNLSTLVLSTLNHTARSYILPVQATKHVLGCAPGTLTRTPPLTDPGMSRHSPLARGAAVRTISPSSASRVSVRVCVSKPVFGTWRSKARGG
jgi:hypothetical protein